MPRWFEEAAGWAIAIAALGGLYFLAGSVLWMGIRKLFVVLSWVPAYNEWLNREFRKWHEGKWWARPAAYLTGWVMTAAVVVILWAAAVAVVRAVFGR